MVRTIYERVLGSSVLTYARATLQCLDYIVVSWLEQIPTNVIGTVAFDGES